MMRTAVFVLACVFANVAWSQQKPLPPLPLYVCSKEHAEPCAKTAPRATYTPDPEYSDKARKKKRQGSLVLALVVGTDGLPYDIQPESRLGDGLDEAAIAAVKQWRFIPGKTADGTVVPVILHVEVTFRLY